MKDITDEAHDIVKNEEDSAPKWLANDNWLLVKNEFLKEIKDI